MAATQLPDWDSSIRKAVRLRGGFHTLSAWFDPRYVVIDRKEMYICVTDLRQLTRLETPVDNRTYFHVGALLWATVFAPKAPLVPP